MLTYLLKLTVQSPVLELAGCSHRDDGLSSSGPARQSVLACLTVSSSWTILSLSSSRREADLANTQQSSGRRSLPPGRADRDLSAAFSAGCRARDSLTSSSSLSSSLSSSILVTSSSVLLVNSRSTSSFEGISRDLVFSCLLACKGLYRVLTGC